MTVRTSTNVKKPTSRAMRRVHAARTNRAKRSRMDYDESAANRKAAE